MYYMDFIIAIMGEVKYSVFKSRTFNKITDFWCGYSWINLDKTGKIASIFMHF